MSTVPKLEVNEVRKFHPFDSQSIKKIKEIITNSTIQKLPADRVLFKRGDRDKWTIYLLSGIVEITLSNGKKQIIEADTDTALNSISNQIPRIATAKSQTDISILIIDRSLLQIILNNNDGSIEVGGIDEEDWKSRFLQSNAFLQLPAANIQALMMRLKEEHLTAGSMVIKENSPNNDKFYIIQEGTCLVTKTNPSTGKESTLAKLGHGTGVGEEALITGGVRSASVTMETDGIIMTLGKKDFLELLVEPLIHRIKHNELDELISSGEFLLIDVRSENEYIQSQLENTAYNIPIHLIRSQLEQLEEEKHYILYSNNEKRSSAAAFLFIQQGFDCSILEEGIGGVEPQANNESSSHAESLTNSASLDDDKPSTSEETSDLPITEQLLISKNKYKKIETLATGLKTKAQESIKFTKLKAKQLELLNQKLKAESQRAEKAEAELKRALEEIKQLKQ